MRGEGRVVPSEPTTCCSFGMIKKRSVAIIIGL